MGPEVIAASEVPAEHEAIAVPGLEHGHDEIDHDRCRGGTWSARRCRTRGSRRAPRFPREARGRGCGPCAPGRCGRRPRRATSSRSTISWPAVPISVWTRIAAPVRRLAMATASSRRPSDALMWWYDAPALIAPARAGSSGMSGSVQSEGCIPRSRSVITRSGQDLDRARSAPSDRAGNGYRGGIRSRR